MSSAGGPLSASPDPDSWTGDELKNYAELKDGTVQCSDEAHQPWQCTNCSESQSCSFDNLKMIFNITTCGKWAGNKFDDSDEALKNCRKFIRNEGRAAIDGQAIRIEYVSVREL